MNKIFTVPDSCQGSLSSLSSSTVDQLLSCPDVVALKVNFTDYYCPLSFDTVCATAYTDNPPFSCSRNVRSTYITIVANSFSNASLVGTVLVVLIHFTLKRLYPNGILYAHGVKNKDDGNYAEATPIESLSTSSKKRIFGFQLGMKRYSPIHPGDASKEDHLDLDEILKEEKALSDDGNDHSSHGHVEITEEKEGENEGDVGNPAKGEKYKPQEPEEQRDGVDSFNGEDIAQDEEAEDNNGELTESDIAGNIFLQYRSSRSPA